MDIVSELFFSNFRAEVDKALKSKIKSTATNTELYQSCIYHLRLDDDIISPTLEYSKRIRPYFCMLIGSENGYNMDMICALASSIELIHNASLIVDDIQDNDTFRCGREALWSLIGIPKAASCAYFLEGIGQQLFHDTMRRYSLYDYTSYFYEQMIALVNGQHDDLCEAKQGIESYLSMVDGKTGALLRLSFILGATPHDYDANKVLVIENLANSFARIHQLNDDIDGIKDNKKNDTSILEYIPSSDLITVKNYLTCELFNTLEEVYRQEIVRTKKFEQVITTLVTRHK